MRANGAGRSTRLPAPGCSNTGHGQLTGPVTATRPAPRQVGTVAGVSADTPCRRISVKPLVTALVGPADSRAATAAGLKRGR